MTGSTAAAAFDRLADGYNQTCANEIFVWMRGEVQARFLSDLAPGRRILELGCGAGHDCAWLAARGMDMVSCDPAAGMIRQTAQRLDDAGVSARVTLAPVGAEAIDEWLRERPALPQSFEVLFSNFGALNCVADLRVLAPLVANRVVPGGRLVICLMSRLCAWEVLYHAATLRPGLATRRWGRPTRATEVQVAGLVVPTYYYSVRSVAHALGGVARLQRVRGLSVVVPPPYLERLWRGLPDRLRAATMAMDRMVAGRGPFNRLGDHIVLEFARR